MGAVVNRGAEIGDGSLIGSGSVVGTGVTIGPSSRIGTQVSLQNCVLGSHVILHAGVKIGQDGEYSSQLSANRFCFSSAVADLIWYTSISHCADDVMSRSSATGFGFYVDEKGMVVKKPQVSVTAYMYGNYCSIAVLYMTPHASPVTLSLHLSHVSSCCDICNSYNAIHLPTSAWKTLGVQIGSNVEIGANSCIDRGRCVPARRLLGPVCFMKIRRHPAINVPALKRAKCCCHCSLSVSL